MHPGAIVDKLAQEHACRNHAPSTSADIAHVGHVALELLEIFLPERHLPHAFAGLLTGFFHIGLERVVVPEHPDRKLSQGHDTRTGQRGNIDDTLRVEPGRISQPIRQHQPAFGIGILHLHGFAIKHAQDVPRFRGPPARHVFRRRQDTHDVEAQTQLRRSPDCAQHLGPARHVRLHLFHIFRRFQGNAAGIERDRFPHKHHGPVFFLPP